MADRVDIGQLFERFSRMNVLIVGDAMIDSYIYGRVERVSPEAPVPVVDVDRREHRLGGAANVALNISRLGANAWLCAPIGTEENGDLLIDLMHFNKLSIEGLQRIAGRPTSRKTRVLSRNQQMLRIDQEETSPLDAFARERFLSHIKELLQEKQPDVVILEDYNKGALPIGIIKGVISLCKSLRIPVAVDPKKLNFFAYQGATLFKPNLRELADALLLNIDPADESQLKTATDALKERLKHLHTLLTLGSQGIYYRNEKESGLSAAYTPRQVADVSGAGDSVIAVASLALAAGLAISQIAQLANIAGALATEAPGVAPVDKERLQELATRAFSN